MPTRCFQTTAQLEVVSKTLYPEDSPLFWVALEIRPAAVSPLRLASQQLRMKTTLLHLDLTRLYSVSQLDPTKLRFVAMSLPSTAKISLTCHVVNVTSPNPCRRVRSKMQRW